VKIVHSAIRRRSALPARRGHTYLTVPLISQILGNPDNVIAQPTDSASALKRRRLTPEPAAPHQRFPAAATNRAPGRDLASRSRIARGAAGWHPPAPPCVVRGTSRSPDVRRAPPPAGQHAPAASHRARPGCLGSTRHGRRRRRCWDVAWIDVVCHGVVLLYSLSPLMLGG